MLKDNLKSQLWLLNYNDLSLKGIYFFAGDVRQCIVLADNHLCIVYYHQQNTRNIITKLLLESDIDYLHY